MKPESAGSPVASDVRGDDRAGDLRADGRADVAHDRVTPVASPVSCASTATTIRFGIAANAAPTPAIMRQAQRITSAARAVREGDARAARPAVRSAAGEERQLGAEALADPADERRDEQRDEAAGREQQAGLGGARGRSPTSPPVGQLGELRDEHERADHRRADQQRRDVRRQHGPAREGLHVDQRLRRARARTGRSSASTTRPAAIRPSVAAEPQPQSAPREIAISSAVRPTARMPAPTKSTRPGVRTGDSGTNRIVVIVASDAHDRGEPEDPVVAGPVDEHAAERQADRRRRSPAIAPSSAMPVGTLLARELVADDPEATAGTRRRRGPAGRGRRSSAPSESTSAHTTEPTANSAERDRQQALLAEHVAEAAEDRRRDRGDEQVRGDHPRDAAWPTRRARAAGRPAPG